MPVLIDGYLLKYNTRTRMAERRWGDSVDLVPVIWLKDWRQGPAPKREKDAKSTPRRDSFVAVRCADATECAARAADTRPFVVALATTKAKAEGAEGFGEFRGVFEVAATGATPSDTSFEVKVIRRLTPQTDPAPASPAKPLEQAQSR
jgi:hypothetical protein